MKRTMVFVVLALLLAGCGTRPGPEGQPVELVVSAAASMGDALKEARAAFEQEHRQVKIRLNLGSSGALGQQIEQGAPADLFISAGKAPMDRLVKKGLVEQAAVKTVATNRVVLIRPRSAIAGVAGWDDLKAAKKLAVANPEHVPAGQYAQGVLENLGLWAAMQGRLVMGEDVRNVLNFVESGEVDAGIVYSTDAALSQKVVVAAEAPAGSHAPVAYPMAVLKESKHREQAGALADFLVSSSGQAILKKYGFGAGN